MKKHTYQLYFPSLSYTILCLPNTQLLTTHKYNATTPPPHHTPPHGTLLQHQGRSTHHEGFNLIRAPSSLTGRVSRTHFTECKKVTCTSSQDTNTYWMLSYDVDDVHCTNKNILIPII